MNIKREHIFTICLGVIFILSLITNWYAFLVVANVVVLLMNMLDKMGHGIVLREIIALHSSFACLLMPLIGYTVYDRSNYLAVLWVKYMPVPQDVYFDYALPAVSGFALAICWPILSKESTDRGQGLQRIIDKAKTYLTKNPMLGIYVMSAGVAAYFASAFLPVAIKFVFNLLFIASFSGFLYLYFTSGFKRKVIIMAGFAIFIFASALRSGMFTIVAYMSLTLISFFFLGRNASFLKKLSVFVIGLVFMFTLQGVKLSYRKLTWSGKFEGNRVTLFFDLIGKQLTGTGAEDWATTFFPVFVRGNQGFNVGLVMYRIPKMQEFDGGKNIFTNLMASFVPRVFWPDKPEAGGKFNMKFYTGFSIDGWSTNVGPLGEAYGSFGVSGGIIFIIILGAFIRWAYRLVFQLSQHIHLLLFWIPVLFYQITYSAESDTLQILNSLIKSAFFLWVLVKIKPAFFAVVKKRRPGQGNYSPANTDIPRHDMALE